MLKDERVITESICAKLTLAKSSGIDGLVGTDEVEAIKQSIIAEYGNSIQASNFHKNYVANFVSYDEMLIFIKAAALFTSAIVF